MRELNLMMTFLKIFELEPSLVNGDKEFIIVDVDHRGYVIGY